MKYKVIGWTSYDGSDIQKGEYSEAAENAIIDDIRAHGYLFSGYSHQELTGCAPVLNDGKKRLFTQRNWGNLMAKAWGDFNPMSYARYAFLIEDEKTPPTSAWIAPDDIPKKDIREKITLTVSEEVFKKAEQDGEYLDYATDSLRYLETGDFLTLTAGEKKVTYKVTEAVWGWDKEENGKLTPIFLHDLLNAYHFHESKEEREKAGKLYEHGKRVILAKLQKLTDEV